ncbi:MAG: helix-turn-helix domain-containing protein [Kiritimatiellia bacterium]
MTDSVDNMSYIDISEDAVSLSAEVAVEQLCEADWQWHHRVSEWQRESSLMLWLVTGGKAALKSRFGPFDVRRGRFYVMPAFLSDYHGTHDPGDPLHVCWAYVSVRGPRGKRIKAAGLEGIPFQTELSDLAVVLHLMRRLISAGDELRPHWLRVMLDEVRQQASALQASRRNPWIQELGREIQADPGRFHDLDDMLAERKMTRDHLIRLFKEQYRVTPGEFLIRSRMDRARGLLAVSNLTVKEIAARLGYRDAFSFSRQFKARTGQSPTVFRRTCGRAYPVHDRG